ncbi:MAG: hypothetical protein Ta2F_08790 [Termitinemataceae bacterium]|nr:MAG: hypothetical protein Ta2F_08790 [Termitinemataceae bacterium]
MELLIRSLPLTKKNKTEESQRGFGLNRQSKHKKLFDAVKIKLDAYLSKYLLIQGFILDVPVSCNANGKSQFYKIVSGQVAAFGAVLRLPSSRTIVFLPADFDAALVAHRICNNLNTSALLFLESDNSKDIIQILQDY